MFARSSMRFFHSIPAVCALLTVSASFASALPIAEQKEESNDAQQTSVLRRLMQSIADHGKAPGASASDASQQQIAAQSKGMFGKLGSYRRIRDATPYYTADSGFNRVQNDAGVRQTSDPPVFNQTLVSVISLRVSSSVAHAIHPSMSGNMHVFLDKVPAIRQVHYPSLIAEAKKHELSMPEAEPTAVQDKTSYEASSAGSSSSYRYLKVAPSSAPVSSTPLSPVVYEQPEENYEVDERLSVATNGRAHGVQPSYRDGQHIDIYRAPPRADKDQKVGYVVEGRNYRKYRVEERTPDGFIVGEYGVMDHDDGSLRGVRYTADGTINPKLIHSALMKFLSL